MIGYGVLIGGVIGDGKSIYGIRLGLMLRLQGRIQILRVRVVQEFIPSFIDGVDTRPFGGEEAGIPVGNPILIADEGEVIVVILSGITGIPVFQEGELGDLLGLALIPVVHEEDVVMIIGRQYRVSRLCPSGGTVRGINDAGLIREGDKGSVQLVVYVIGDLPVGLLVHLVDIDVHLAFPGCAHQQSIIVQHVFHVLHLVEVGQVLYDPFIFGNHIVDK